MPTLGSNTEQPDLNCLTATMDLDIAYRPACRILNPGRVKSCMESLLSPTMDFVFKRLFGTEDNQTVLLDFLNSVFLDAEQPHITHIDLLNPYLEKDHEDDKLGIVDVRARTEDGALIDIEVQVAPDPDFDRRTLYYWAKLFTGQITEGQGYWTLHPALTINIVDFIIRPEPAYHTVFTLREQHSGQPLSDALRLHFLELPKFQRQEIANRHRLAQWLLFFTLNTPEQLEGLAMDDPVMKKAVTNLEWLSQDRATRERYEARQKALRDELSRTEGARRQALKQGREEGREEGRQEGELAKQQEIARKMLQAGVEPAHIAEWTSLTLDEIARL